MKPSLMLFYARSVLMLICLLQASCASLIPEFDPPKITVESVDTLPSSDMGPRFRITLRVANPNKQALDIAGISYSIHLLDSELVSGVTNEVPKIEPYAEEVVTLEAGVNLFQLLRLLATLGKSQSEPLEYRFGAKIDFNGFVPTQRVEERGILSLN